MMRCFLLNTTPHVLPALVPGPLDRREVHGQFVLVTLPDRGISLVLWLDDADPQQADEIAWIGTSLEELTLPPRP